MAMPHQNDEPEGLIWSSLPADLALHVLSFLPSPLLFQCRGLSKAAHKCALRLLARRPFFVYQKPSLECFMLPLDALSTPLPFSFNVLPISSFTLFSSSANLICLQRRNRSMLRFCVRSIFCKWKVTLPPIVHPDYVPRLLRRVFTEDSDVDSLQLIIFKALPAEGSERSHGSEDESSARILGAHDPSHAQGSQILCDVCLTSHSFCIFAANNSYARMFDSRQQQSWSDPIYSLTDVKAQGPCTKLKVAGFPVEIFFDPEDFKLSIGFLPLAEGISSSTSARGFELEGVCESDRGPLFSPSMHLNFSEQHCHSYAREYLHVESYTYQSKLYFLAVEIEKILCHKQNHPTPLNNTVFHSIQPEDVERYLFLHDLRHADFACHENFPASTPCVLALYIAEVDTINWTMQIRRENATALLKLSDMSEIPCQGVHYDMGKFLLVEGIAPC